VDESELLAEKTESFFTKFTEPQWGHFAKFSQSLDRTKTSESFEQSWQSNS